MPQDSIFGLVLNDLYPLTHCSSEKHCLVSEMAGERVEIRSSELDMGLSSSDNWVWRWTR